VSVAAAMIVRVGSRKFAARDRREAAAVTQAVE